MKNNSNDPIISTPNWQTFITNEQSKAYYIHLTQNLEESLKRGNTHYPDQKDIYKAYQLTEVKNIRAVIIGQDPYHGPNQAHGLAFSVPDNTPVPPSLKNIFKELKRDLNIEPNACGNLSYWAQQGVFLLNTTLTVQAHQPNSHSKIGWQTFTLNSVRYINEQCEHVVFMFWGAHANALINHIDHSKHLVLTSSHPSPLSAHRGFLGCGHFSACNDYLKENGKQEICWDLNSNSRT